jgi:hypothetical protein
LEQVLTWLFVTTATFRKQVIRSFPIPTRTADTNRVINTQLRYFLVRRMAITFCSSNGRSGKSILLNDLFLISDDIDKDIRIVEIRVCTCDLTCSEDFLPTHLFIMCFAKRMKGFMDFSNSF